MKFKKRPATIDAVQWTGENEQEVKDILGDIIIPVEDLLIGSYIFVEDDSPVIMSAETFENIYVKVEEPIVKKRKKHTIKG